MSPAPGSGLETPMMRQYLGVKAQHPDAIVFYRMGDFYEMFLDDAERAAPLLGITLTTRDKNKPDPVPMCGVPVHAADGHIKRLTALGHRVALCEQVENPKTAGKRLVRREVIEVITPGLVGDPAGLEGTSEVALACLDLGVGGADERAVGLAVLDASTGDFRATTVHPAEADAGTMLPALLVQELERVMPREILATAESAQAVRDALALRLPDAVVTEVAAEHFDPSAAPVQPEGLAAGERGADVRAAVALLHYLAANQPFAMRHAPRLRRYELRETMLVDAATRTHLELFENSEDRGRRGTLIEQLDCSSTALGARRIARWLAYPLLEPAVIAARQDAVAYLADRDRTRARLREALREVRDLERLLARAVRPGSVPRDVGQLRSSLEALPALGVVLDSDDEALLPRGTGRPSGIAVPEPLPVLTALLQEALIDDPPVIARGSRGAGETGYIREGYRSDLDVLREAADKGREWIAGLEAAERERTGIANLKVRYHPVHGYSLEVTKTQLARVPDHYLRKQTLASVERFTTEELRERGEPG